MKLPRLVCVPDAMKLPPLVSGATPPLPRSSSSPSAHSSWARTYRGPARALSRAAAAHSYAVACSVPGWPPASRTDSRRRTAPRAAFVRQVDSSQRYTAGRCRARAPGHLDVERAARPAAAGGSSHPRPSQWPHAAGSRRRRREPEMLPRGTPTSLPPLWEAAATASTHDVRGLVAAVAGAVLGDRVRYGGRHVGHGPLVTRSVRRVASSRQLRKFAERLLTLLAALLAIARAASSSPRASNRHADQLLAPSTACAIGRKVNGPPLPACAICRNKWPTCSPQATRGSAASDLPSSRSSPRPQAQLAPVVLMVALSRR